jgi:hypothetical protein
MRSQCGIFLAKLSHGCMDGWTDSFEDLANFQYHMTRRVVKFFSYASR